MEYSTWPKNTKDRSPLLQQVTTFQLPEAIQATAGREYILMILGTRPVSVPVVQPTQIAAPQPATVIAKVQQPQRPASASVQPASYLIVDDQQPGIPRHLMFTLSPAKKVNPPSVASGQQEDSQHNTSGLSSLFESIPSVLQYQHIDTPQLFSPSQLQPAPSPVPSTSQQEQSRPPSQFSQQLVVPPKQKSIPSNTYTSPKYTTQIV